jgi:hypothetical protein
MGYRGRCEDFVEEKSDGEEEGVGEEEEREDGKRVGIGGARFRVLSVARGNAVVCIWML